MRLVLGLYQRADEVRKRQGLDLDQAPSKRLQPGALDPQLLLAHRRHGGHPLPRATSIM